MFEIINVKNTKASAFTSHTFAGGLSGSGKTNSMEFLLENYFLFGKRKCFDIDTSGRFENCSYSIAEDNPQLIAQMNWHPDLVKNYGLEPTTFNSEILMFCGRGLLYNNTFPKTIKIVSFAKEDLTWDFIKILLGNTPALGNVLNVIQSKFGTDINFKDIETIIFNRNFRGDKVPKNFKVNEFQEAMIKNNITSWNQTGLFSDNVGKINFDEIINNKSIITCFNTYLQETPIEEEIAIAIILNQILELVKKRKVNHRVLVYLRELADYLHFELCKDNLMQILRKGRTLGHSGIDLFADSQLPTDMKPNMRRQWGYYSQMKAHREIARHIQEIQPVPNDVVDRIPRFNIGQSVLLTGNRYDVPIQFPPTRHKHVTPGFNVLNSLGDRDGWVQYDADMVLAHDFIPTYQKERDNVVIIEPEGDIDGDL